MKININVTNKTNIDYGDIIVCEKGKYLIIYDPSSNFNCSCINLIDCVKENAFTSIEELQKASIISSKGGNIIEIIKSEDLEIRRIDEG